MMDSSLLIAAGASFVVGMAGYIIVRFWIRPITRYTATRRKIKRELTYYLAVIDESTGVEKKGTSKKEPPALRQARKHTLALATFYNEEIPYWYRLLLDSREEAPADALVLISHLSKLRDRKEIKSHIDKARKNLGIKTVD